MTIHFGPLESSAIVGSANGGLALSGYGQGAAALRTLGVAAGVLALAGLASGPAISNTTAVAQGGFVVGGRGWSHPHTAERGDSFGTVYLGGQAGGYLTYGEPPVHIPPTASGTFTFDGVASGYARQFGAVVGDVAFDGMAYGAEGGASINGYSDGAYVFAGSAAEGASLGAYGFVVDNFPVVAGYGGIEFAFSRERLSLGAASAPLPTMVTRERVGFGGLPASAFEGIVAAYDRLSIGDRLTPIVMALVEDAVVLNAIAEGDHSAFVRVVERLLLTGDARSLAEAVAIVADAMVLGAIADALQVGHSEDTLLLGEVIASTYQVVAAAVERLLLAGTGDSHYLAMALVRDTVQLSDGVLHEAELAALVRDAISFAANIRLDNGEYIAWVMNTESKGLSRYTNYPFNSFAKIGDRYVGCSPQGLHWLDGATDNGDEIHAKLRLGMEDMGTRRLKNIPDAYIGYTSDGVLLLRAIYTHEATGDRVAATYRLSPREAHEKREHRFKLGRGLKAVDWDFEIENVDGSDFMLDNVEFRPLVLNRRTRG